MVLADSIILSFGWRRRLLAFVAGAVGALAMAPFDLFPALVVPMVIAVWLIDGSSQAMKGAGWRNAALIASAISAARDGWWLGFGFFVAGLWWLGAAFLVEPEQFAWAMPFAIFGLPAVLALFMGLGFGLARLLWSAGPGRIMALAFGHGARQGFRRQHADDDGQVAQGQIFGQRNVGLHLTAPTTEAGSTTGGNTWG
jgi:apolipoprotein N-acyltransferase